MIKPIINIFIFWFLLILSIACKVTSDQQVSLPAPADEPMADEDSLQQEDSLAYHEETAKVIPEEDLSPYRASRTRKHDLIHTKLEVRFDIKNHWLHGVATLELTPYFYPQNELELDAKGFDIHTISLVKDDEKEPLTYQYDDVKLTIALDKTYQKDEHYFIEIAYTAKPDDLPEGGSAAITSDKGLYFIDADSTEFGKVKPTQIWTQGETEANSCWFPTIDSPNERTTQEMFITVDNRFVTLSNGVLEYSEFENDSTRTDYWKMDQPHAPYLFMMAIGEFAIVKDKWNDVPVDYYVEPAYETYAKDIFGNTPEMIELFSKQLNLPFPWPKYSQVVVRDYVSGAMENTTASLFMETLQVDNRELLDYDWDGIIAHELFHQWFGDYVTCESWPNLTLNEGFASYAEYLWSEHKHGQEEADYFLMQETSNYLEESEQKQVDLIRFHYDDREDMFDSHSYSKGGCVLHMLRKYVGDEAFFAALHEYLKMHAFESVEVHDLRLAFEKTTGEDLNWFFNQWFLASGHPKLRIRHSYQQDSLQVEVWQLQDQDSTPIYKLPVNIDIWAGDKRQRHAVDITKTYEVFNFPVSQQPDGILFDSESQLLAEIDHQKSDQELEYQYYHSDKFAPRFEALAHFSQYDSLSGHLQLINDALNDSFWVIRQLAVNMLEDMSESLQPEMITKLESLSTTDPKSMVRADAITTLAAINPDVYKNAFLTGLQDSSYAVVGASIMAYAHTQATDKTKVFAPYIDYKNFNVVMALADYFVESQSLGKYEWFLGKLTQVEDQTLYYLLNYFGRYLLSQSPDLQQQGTALLAKYAEHHPTYYIRLTAYRTLGFFAELPGIEQRRAEIRNVEKDERLQLFYQNNP